MQLFIVKLSREQMRNYSFFDGYLNPLSQEYWSDEETQDHYNEYCKLNFDDPLSFEDWKDEYCLVSYIELRTRRWSYMRLDDNSILVAWL